MSSTDSSPLAGAAKLQCCGLTLKDSEDKCPDCGRTRADLQMDRATAPPRKARRPQPRPGPEPPSNLERMHAISARKRKVPPPSVPEGHNEPGAEQDKPSEKRGVFQDTTQANITNLFAGGVKRRETTKDHAAPRQEGAGSKSSTDTEPPGTPSMEVAQATTAATATADEDTSEGHALTSLVHKGRSGSLIRCQAQHVTGPAQELDIEAYVEASANKDFRRMKWAVLVRQKRGSLVDAWFELRDRLKCEARGLAYIAADTQKEYVVLVFKGADMALQAGKPWQAYKLSCKDPLPFAKALLRCVEAIFTIDVESKEQLARVSAMEAIQPYMKMDELTFKAHVIDLKEMRRRDENLSPEQEFLVNHTKDMEKLKELLLKKERMRSMLKDIESALRFPWDFVLSPQTVKVYRICPDTLRQFVSDRPADAILDAVGLYTIVFYGPPGKGKTPVARACAALYSQSNGKPKFAETQTSDSLRKLTEFALLEDGMGIVLDEWRPRTEPCGPQGGGVDHVKNMLDPADSKTIEARFNDFTLGENMGKFVTCQNLGKLLHTFSGIKSDMDERQLRALTGEDEDGKAILKRCVFVEVLDHLIKPEMRKIHRETRGSKGSQLRAAANQTRKGDEDGQELAVQLGLWRQAGDTKRS